MTKLFISYSRDDKAWVYELWRALRDRAHYDAWIDQRIVPAQDWWDSILTHIEDADCVIYVMTPRSTESIYCLAEVNYALALNKPVLPVMLKTCETPAEIKRRRIQYQIVSDDMGLGDVLFTIERGLGDVRVGLLQGKYPLPNPLPARPDEPKPARKPEQVSEVFMLAEEAAAENNFSLAEKLFQQVIDADPKGYGLAAAERLGAIRDEQERNADYLNIVQMAANPALRRGALALWRVFVKKHGSDYDPNALAALLTERSSTTTPASPSTPATRSRRETSAPAKESDAIEAVAKRPSTSAGSRTPVAGELETASMAIERAHTFTGRRNRDWQPFVTTFADLKIGDMPFCLVPVGSFNMGSDDGHYDDETPVHPQTIPQPYWIAQYPVTNAQWTSAVKAKAVKQPYDIGHTLKWYKDPKMADAAVVGVDWFMARDFAAWLDCRLPTELEWEYAARGVESLRYPWGDDWNADIPIWGENSGGKPAAVTTKPEGKSWVDARHMSGNVWEWTGSLYQPYPYAASDDRERDTGDRTDVRRVLRGGSWWPHYTDLLRAACRYYFSPVDGNRGRGVRVARSR